MNEPETIRTILEKTKTIAVVGLSDKPDRPAFHVSRYMQQEGYRIIPVHPKVYPGTRGKGLSHARCRLCIRRKN